MMVDATRPRWQRGGMFAALAALALVAGGCSKSKSADEDAGNRSELIEPLPEEATPIAEPDAPLPAPEPAAANMTENSSVAVPPEEPTAPDLQVQDDADASGMTARVPRGEQAEGDPPTPAQN